eukprot:TRINITY_DN3577_c0_g1_i2.p1 TRINITY_DN3577_c0_g1~~TRINITY_DN3577_c0_g1_i2.p1  ORF type:complete len:247 (-),score=73.66 TRINITY_DN3577_c0_g1_i2:120-860(-)
MVELVRNTEKALCECCRSAHVEMIKYLLSVYPALGTSKALEMAALKNKKEIAALLLQHELNPPSDQSIFESLKTCCEKGYTEIASLLISSKDIFSRIKDNTPLDLAISENHLDIAKLLLNESSIPLDSNATSISLPILKTIESNEIEMFVELLKHGRAGDPSKLLQILIEEDWTEGIQQLFKHCVLPQDNIERAISKCIKEGELDCLKLLLSLSGVKLHQIVDIGEVIKEAQNEGHTHLIQFIQNL